MCDQRQPSLTNLVRYWEVNKQRVDNLIIFIKQRKHILFPISFVNFKDTNYSKNNNNKNKYLKYFQNIVIKFNLKQNTKKLYLKFVFVNG